MQRLAMAAARNRHEIGPGFARFLHHARGQRRQIGSAAFHCQHLLLRIEPGAQFRKLAVDNRAPLGMFG